MELLSTFNAEMAGRGLALTVAGVGDRLVFADPRATAGDVVRGLGGSDSDALIVARTGQSLPPSAVLGYADLRSGDVVEIGGDVDSPANEVIVGPVTLSFLTGPREGERIELPVGEHRIGRAADNDIVIVDPGISRYHAVISVDRNSVSVADAGSTNGVLVGGSVANGPTMVESSQQFLIGQSWMATTYELEVEEAAWPGEEAGPQRILVTPSTSPLKRYLGERITFPDPPDRGRGWRRNSREGLDAALNLYERSIQAIQATIVKELDAEWTARLAEAPSLDELVDGASEDVQALWSRARTDPLLTRVGLAPLPSRISYLLPQSGDEELRDRVAQVVDQYRFVDGVPVTVDFSSDGSVLVAGLAEPARQLAFSLVAQLVLQHQPNRLRLWGLLAPDRVADWDWLKWLPHCDGYTEDGGFAQLTSDPAEYGNVVDRLAAATEVGGFRPGPLGASATGPVSSLLLIDGGAEVPNDVQKAIEELVSRDDSSTVCALVVGECDPTYRLELPFGRRGTVIIVDQDWASMEVVDDGDEDRPAVLGIDYQVCSDAQISELARRLTCVDVLPPESSAAVRAATPAMFRTEQSPAFGQSTTPSEQPSATPIQNGTGAGATVGGPDPSSLAEQWSEARHGGQLVARIGSGANGPVTLDLRELGPHAIVSGELDGFLPAWVASLAARYSPSDLTFYLIDSTGGTVFRQCRELPHTIGNLSGTSTLDIKPALAMLSAELDRRESVLSGLGVHSIEELERQGHSLPFPYLVVGIDRVETLGDQGVESVVTLDPAAELLSLCERGQQLGMHLLLGTASSIDDRLADRVALRVHAGRFTPSRLVVGQAPPVVFTATLTPLPPEVVVRSFSIDDTSELSRELLPLVERDDLDQLTTLIANAHEYTGEPLPSGLG